MTTARVNRILCEILRQRGAIPDHEAHLLITGAHHAYSCTCDTCREFWRLIGPDPDTNDFGPFGPTLDTQGEPDHDRPTRDHHSP